MKEGKINVLMIGPDRSVHGGISGVVNNYYAAGLDQKVNLYYIGTMVEGSRLRKLFQAALAYIRFVGKLPRYEIVHVNMASDSSYYRKSVFVRTAVRAGKKVVIHQHGGDFQGFYRQLSSRQKERVRKTLSLGDAFLVLAPFWKDFFGTMIDKDKITVFPDAIEIPEPVLKQYGRRQMLFLGRLCKEKGLGELLEVMPLLKEKYPDCHLFLGGIWEEEGLRSRAEALQDCVTWVGWITGEEKERYLKECDIFVLPSYFEGQSVAILEAMAYSCGIVASRTGGIPQMVTDGETGVLVEPRDAQSLLIGLDRLLQDAESCGRLGEQARRKVEQEFSMDRNIESLMEIYHGVCRERGEKGEEL